MARPDASEDRVQADAMLIDRPEVRLCLRMLVLHQGELVRQFF